MQVADPGFDHQPLCIFPWLFHPENTSMLAHLIHFNQSDHVTLQEGAHKLQVTPPIGGHSFVHVQDCPPGRSFIAEISCLLLSMRSMPFSRY